MREKNPNYTVKKQDLSFSEKLLFDLCVVKDSFPEGTLPPAPG